MEEIILRYEKRVYEDKIGDFVTYDGELQGHKETLEGYQSKIVESWDDDAAATYYDAVSEQIRAVNEASQLVKNMSKTYQSVIDNLDRTEEAVQGAMNDVMEVVKTAADLISGLGKMGG